MTPSPTGRCCKKVKGKLHYFGKIEGDTDVANLPIDAVDFDLGLIDFPRPKTGLQRRCPLWPETTAAIKAWLEVRPEPKDVEAHGNLLFITEGRTTWGNDLPDGFADGEIEDLYAFAKKCQQASDNPLSKEIRKLLNKLDIKRQGMAFYSLRHVFESIGGESRDQVAVDFIMGHARDDMASRHRERISDERLRAVTDHVRIWLFDKQSSDADANEADEGEDETDPATADDDKTPAVKTAEAKQPWSRLRRTSLQAI